MGFYIRELADGTPIPGKDAADFLLKVSGAYQIHPPPEKWEEDLVCVIENGNFDAVGYIYSQRELVRFLPRPGSAAFQDRRRRSWIHFPGAGVLCPNGQAARLEEEG